MRVRRGRNEVSHSGVEVWTDTHLVRWDWGPPTLWATVGSGQREQVPVVYTPYDFSEFTYLTGAIRSMVDALGSHDPLAAHLSVSGSDVRAALEISTAAYHSAAANSAPVRLPLADRSSDPLYPRPYRWVGGDARPSLLEGGLGAATPQSAEEVRI